MSDFKIPLRNNKKEIVEYALVSEEDFEKVNKYKWCLFGNYVTGKVNRKPVRLHHFVLKTPDDGYVIDHIDRNPLNNKRDNLREVTYSINSQNKTKKNESTSKYIGVHLRKKKWQAQYNSINIGRFENEIDAGKQYDTYVMLLNENQCATNGLVNYDDIKHLKLEDIVPDTQTKPRDLPKNICKSNGNFHVNIAHNKVKYTKCCKTLEDAERILKTFKEQIDVEKERIKNQKVEISRNDKGEAVIYTYNKQKEINGFAIVDDDKWHELSKLRWWMREGYVRSQKGREDISMHRYIVKAESGQVIDHINNIKHDNRISNLRINDIVGNNHNRKKTKNASSKYFGVCKGPKNRWIAQISRKYQNVYLGGYKTECEAAIAYNIKSKDLHKEYAQLNEISEENMAKYFDSVNDKVKKLLKTN